MNPRTRTTCLLAAAVFSLFTYWQFNDLDQYGTEWWEGWVMLYGLVALASLVTAFRPLPFFVYVVASLALFVAAVVRILDIEWEKGVFFNEANPAGNESGGFLVTAVWLGWMAFRVRRKP